MALAELVKWWRRADYLFGAGLAISRAPTAASVLLTVSSACAAVGVVEGLRPAAWGLRAGPDQLSRFTKIPGPGDSASMQWVYAVLPASEVIEFCAAVAASPALAGVG